jgi:hypothetical protein
MRAAIAFLVTTFLFTQALAATYYFDFATGSDSNAGTKISPWKHHKYMTGATSNAAAMIHAAGDQYIQGRRDMGFNLLSV